MMKICDKFDDPPIDSTFISIECGLHWLYQSRKIHQKENTSAGSAEGDPTAAGKCLTGGGCRENKPRISHGATRLGIFTGPRRCSDLHTV